MGRPPEQRQEAYLDPLDLYLKEASATPLLTAEQERAFAGIRHAGDRAYQTLLRLTQDALRGQLESPRIRRVAGRLRTMLAVPLLERARRKGLLHLPLGLSGHDLDTADLLAAAIAIARTAGTLRHRRTQKSDMQDILDRLLAVVRFVNCTVIPLARDLAGAEQLSRFREKEDLRGAVKRHVSSCGRRTCCSSCQLRFGSSLSGAACLWRIASRKGTLAC